MLRTVLSKFSVLYGPTRLSSSVDYRVSGYLVSDAAAQEVKIPPITFDFPSTSKPTMITKSLGNETIQIKARNPNSFVLYFRFQGSDGRSEEAWRNIPLDPRHTFETYGIEAVYTNFTYELDIKMWPIVE